MKLLSSMRKIHIGAIVLDNMRHIPEISRAGNEREIKELYKL